MLKKSTIILGLMGIGVFGYASPKMVLDTVEFQVMAKQAVTTQTALLTVNVNATLNNANVVQVRNEVVDNLNKIVQGEWQFIQFDRSQDNSGLEKLMIVAQARILQANLKDIYQNALKISKPGISYQIQSVEFKPSLEEVQQVKAQLREALYQQINAEISRLNRIYPEQKYSLHEVEFYEGTDLPVQPKEKSRGMNAMVMAAPMQSVSVSSELILSALVELASNRGKADALTNQ